MSPVPSLLNVNRIGTTYLQFCTVHGYVELCRGEGHIGSKLNSPVWLQLHFSLVSLLFSAVYIPLSALITCNYFIYLLSLAYL